MSHTHRMTQVESQSAAENTLPWPGDQASSTRSSQLDFSSWLDRGPSWHGIVPARPRGRACYVRVTDGAGAVIYVATPPSPPSATPVPTPFKPTASDGGVADSPLRFRTLSDSRDQPTSTQVDGTQCTPCAPEDFKPAILRLCGTNGAYTTQELDCSILPDRHG